jgi:hypothetical protein
MLNTWIIEFERQGKTDSVQFKYSEEPDNNQVAKQIIIYLHDKEPHMLLASSEPGAPDFDKLSAYGVQLISVAKASL